jgi:predicted  nucleic acid-binding Zn-ribbon protein
MSWEIPIYKHEKNDGIAHKVREQSSIAYISPINTEKPVTLQLNDAQVLNRIVAGKKDSDLFFMNSILATVCWNLNDDVFDPYETWAARHTAEDKSLNVGHKPTEIVGHITDSYAVDADIKLIAESTSVDELPAKFHIFNGEVIYKTLGNEEYDTKVAKLIESILAGELAVSMECFFRGFDYAVIGPDGTQKIIARNEESSFLTKYLRAYGGDGFFVNTDGKYRLGRVMRNIVFSGKGIVEYPANPDSKIFQSASDFLGSVTNLGYIQVGYAENKNKGEKVMPAENTNLTDFNVLTTKVAELTQALTRVEADRDGLKQKLTDINVQATNATIEGLKTDVSKRDTEITELKSKLTTAEATLVEKNKQIENIQSQVATLQKQVDDTQAELKTSARESLLVSKGAPVEDAKKLVKSFAGLADEQFNALVEVISDKWQKKNSNSTTTNQTTAAIDNATPNPDAALNTDNNTSREQTRAELSKYLGSLLHNDSEEEK